MQCTVESSCFKAEHRAESDRSNCLVVSIDQQLCETPASILAYVMWSRKSQEVIAPLRDKRV